MAEAKSPKPAKKPTKEQLKIEELTQDLQRTRADFENYRKRVDAEKQAARDAGQTAAIMKLLPVVDNIERALAYLPEDLKDNSWAQSVAGLMKNLDSALESLNVQRINADAGTPFNPDVHEAIQFNEDAEGEHEVIESVLQAGYTHNGSVLRHAMVKVTKQ